MWSRGGGFSAREDKSTKRVNSGLTDFRGAKIYDQTSADVILQSKNLTVIFSPHFYKCTFYFMYLFIFKIKPLRLKQPQRLGH